MRTPRLYAWMTVLLLVAGYSGYYLCRANFSVSKPLLLAAYPNLDKAALGFMATVGTGLYAVGKFVHGSLADLLTGRRLFLYGGLGAIAFNLLFVGGGLPLFTLAWAGNRFVQSAGWGGMVKVASRWFGYRTYGRAMGVISLSYLFGDFLSRLFLGEVIARGGGWREVFWASAAGLALIILPILWFLRESPRDRGFPEPESAPGTEPQQAVAATPLREALLPLLRNPNFRFVCAISFGFTLMRETFNEWTPTYLVEMGGLAEADAARASSLFPLFGGFSVLAVGLIADRTAERGRAPILWGGLVVGTLGLAALALAGKSPLLVPLVAGVGLFLIGPYSLLAGAVALDFGGKVRSATAAGWVDGIGYLGGMVSGFAVGKVAQEAGWASAFWLLTCVSALTAGLTWAYRTRESKP